MPETETEKRMETDLRTRLAAVRELKEAFGIDIQKITNFSEPPRNRTTVAKVLSGADERYLTETNLAAIEKGVQRVLDAYRRRLCG